MLGVRPAVIAPLVRQLAAEASAAPAREAELMGCWVSLGWSRDLSVQRRDGWEDIDLGPDGPAGMALLLVARAARHDRVSVCGYLVDTFCLGVKNAIGPEEMRRRDIPSFVRMYFMAFPRLRCAHRSTWRSISSRRRRLCEQPRVRAASRLRRGARHLGELTEPCAITFGCQGRPLYVAGPYDNPIAVLQTLKAAVGSDGFAVAA
jgi:hypothetical protein